MDQRDSDISIGFALARTRRWKALQSPAAEETGLRMKVSCDDQFDTGDGSERRAWTKPWKVPQRDPAAGRADIDKLTEVDLPNLWDDKNARELARL